MSFVQTDRFVSAAAPGKDWRDSSKAVLESIQNNTRDLSSFNFGFLYVTDHLIDDVDSILNLFQSVLNIDHWVGCTGVGVCASGTGFIDRPAISLMLGKFDEDTFQLFSSGENDSSDLESIKLQTNDWLKENDPMMVLVHGDPLADTDPVKNVQDLRTLTDGFLIGGLSSSRADRRQISGKSTTMPALSGVLFSDNVKIATALTQGCSPIGHSHTITQGHDHKIEMIDDQTALSVFEDDLRAMTVKKIDQNPDEIVLEIDEKTGKEKIPEEYQHLFKGDIHVAFPISESDQQDYLVRNIIDMDVEDGMIAVSQNVSSGERILFVHRSEETVKQDLSHMLIELRKRVQKDQGDFNVKGAIYISCAARAYDENGAQKDDEMALIQEVIGDVPLTGFYAGGEILNGRLYSYTGILTLFL